MLRGRLALAAAWALWAARTSCRRPLERLVQPLGGVTGPDRAVSGEPPICIAPTVTVVT